MHPIEAPEHPVLSHGDQEVLDSWAHLADRSYRHVGWSLLVGEDGVPGILFHVDPSAGGGRNVLGSARRLPDGCWGASIGDAFELSARADSLGALMVKLSWLWDPDRR